MKLYKFTPTENLTHYVFSNTELYPAALDKRMSWIIQKGKNILIV